MKFKMANDAPPEPSSTYAEIASAARACCLNIRDDDYERIDDMIEVNTDEGRESEEDNA